MKEIKHFINGAFVAMRGGSFFDDISPVDGGVIATVHEAGLNDVDDAAGAARTALSGEWRSMTMQQRVELLYKVAKSIEARFDEFLQAECADTGKPCSLARHIDIPRGAANFRVFADMVKSITCESYAMETPDSKGALNYSLREPRGVIAIISPWNLPLLLTTWKVGPALACGNTVVVKPSEETPLTTSLLGEVMSEAGVPPGVFNVVHGFGDNSAGAFLTEHPDIDAITFTGETVTGEIIMRAAAKGSRPVSLEMGGKNPALVFADCDLSGAIEGTTRSVFANCGQVCLGTERVFVERPVFDEFVERLKTAAENLKQGRPEDPETSMGPLISIGHREKVLAHYDKAAKEGTVITGGGIPDMGEELQAGAWIEPTVWTGLADDSAVVKEEIFGPCCHVRPFDTEEEAIALANDTDYGLAASIWTGNSSRAHRVAARINAGVIWVNSWFLRDLRTPFGGMKRSGIGREGGVHSIEFYTELKNICVKL